MNIADFVKVRWLWHKKDVLFGDDNTFLCKLVSKVPKTFSKDESDHLDFLYKSVRKRALKKESPSLVGGLSSLGGCA